LLIRTSFCEIGCLFFRIFCFGFLLFCPQLRADVGLLLSEPTGQGAQRWTSTGHAAVYFSRICPASPVKLRLCGPGEPGSVFSNYSSFEEDQPYEWNVVPLNVFLYGVENERDQPLFASSELRRSLQQRFLERELLEVCTGPCTENRRAHWRDMVAATFARDIYLFQVKTTLDQDLKLIAKYNTMANVDHYNGFTQNCADFARGVINTYFPGAARPDHLNDFGMTSPKAIAKSFSRYAKRHPELQFYVRRFSQVHGDFKRSGECRKGTEVAFRFKKWLFPMLLKSHELALFAASYFLTGQFNPERELRRRPTEQVAAAELESAAARSDNYPALLQQLQQKEQQERAGSFGTAEEWKSYAGAFDTLIDQAVEKGIINNRSSLGGMFRDLDAHGVTFIDNDGAAWLDLLEGETVRRAGVSASNIDAPGSDPLFAYRIMLARVDRILKGSRKNREMMPQFKADWALLERTRERLDSTNIPAVMVASAPGAAKVGEKPAEGTRQEAGH
jgi:hypothetical protein